MDLFVNWGVHSNFSSFQTILAFTLLWTLLSNLYNVDSVSQGGMNKLGSDWPLVIPRNVTNLSGSLYLSHPETPCQLPELSTSLFLPSHPRGQQLAKLSTCPRICHFNTHCLKFKCTTIWQQKWNLPFHNAWLSIATETLY
jgi:hypothetical protein